MSFRGSSALFDRAGVLAGWDQGFESEFAAVGPLNLRNATYPEIFGAILSRGFQAWTVEGDAIDIEVAKQELAKFGTPRSFVYRNPDGQIIRVEEAAAVSGGVFRIAQDVTDEWHQKAELADARKRLESAQQTPTIVPFKFRIAPDGRMELPRPTKAVKRLFGLGDDFVSTDPMAVYAHMDMTAQERAAMTDEARRCIATLEPFAFVFRIRDEKGNLRWIHTSLMPRRLADGAAVLEGGLRDITSETLAQDQIDLLRAVVVESSDSVIVIETSPTGKSTILYVNPAFERLFGRTLAELAGTDAEDYTDEPDKLAIDQKLRERLVEGNETPIEFPIPDSNGDFIWVEARICLLQGQLDGTHRWATISRDISERKRAENELAQSERMLREAQRLAKTGTWEADLATGALRWSRGMYDLIDLDPERHTPDIRHFLSLVHPDDRELTERLTAQIFAGAGGALAGSYRVVLPDGSERTLQSRIEIIKNTAGTPERIVGTIQDITEQRMVEGELMRAVERAKTADKAKSEFLAHMSHELRTPLNAIIGFSQLLMLKDRQFPLSVKQEGYLRDIHNSGEHLLDVINDILDLARIEAGQTSLEEELFDVQDAIDWTFRLLAERAEAVGVTLCADSLAELPYLRGDPRLVRQALLNLLSNAIKFSVAGGCVRVKATRDDSGKLALSVSDTGIGMTAEEIDVALAPFGQVESVLHRRFDGTGLGLPLAKKFIELHGGGLVIESVPKQGTSVTIMFPQWRCTEQAGQPVTT